MVVPLRFRTGRGRLGQPGVGIVIVTLVFNRRNRGFRSGHFDFRSSEGVNAVPQVPLPPLPALGEEGLRNCGGGLKRGRLAISACLHIKIQSEQTSWGGGEYVGEVGTLVSSWRSFWLEEDQASPPMAPATTRPTSLDLPPPPLPDSTVLSLTMLDRLPETVETKLPPLVKRVVDALTEELT